MSIRGWSKKEELNKDIRPRNERARAVCNKVKAIWSDSAQLRRRTKVPAFK